METWVLVRGERLPHRVTWHGQLACWPFLVISRESRARVLGLSEDRIRTFELRVFTGFRVSRCGVSRLGDTPSRTVSECPTHQQKTLLHTGRGWRAEQRGPWSCFPSRAGDSAGCPGRLCREPLRGSLSGSQWNWPVWETWPSPSLRMSQHSG